MANASQVAEQAAAWRNTAKRAKRLAGTFIEGADRDRLLWYAAELDAKAAQLEAEALDHHNEPQQAEGQQTPTSASASSEPKTKA
jgi:hypothetical protein